MSLREVLDARMKNDDDVIALQEEMIQELTRCQRNLVLVLFNHPKGIYSKKLFELIKNKNPSTHARACEHKLAKYGLEIYCERHNNHVEALWMLRKIKLKEVKENKSNQCNQKPRFNTGDVAWYFTWPVDEYGCLDVKNIKLHYFYVQNPKELNDRSLSYCFKSSQEAISVHMNRLAEILNACG
jgi:hypothetical protein